MREKGHSPVQSHGAKCKCQGWGELCLGLTLLRVGIWLGFQAGCMQGLVNCGSYVKLVNKVKFKASPGLMWLGKEKEINQSINAAVPRSPRTQP